MQSHREAAFLRAFVEAARTHISSPHIGIATSFLAAIETRVSAWDPLAFVPLADIVARKIANQYVIFEEVVAEQLTLASYFRPRHTRLRMLEQVTRAVCRFSDPISVSSPRQLSSVLSAFPRGFFSERPALRVELRAWQDSLAGGSGKGSLLNDLMADLSSATPSADQAADQMTATEKLADQTSALLFVREGESGAIMRQLLERFEWPTASVLRSEKALIAIGAIVPALPVLEQQRDYATHIAAVMDKLRLYTEQRIVPWLTGGVADESLLEYSLLSTHAYLRALSALLRHASSSNPALRSMAAALTVASTSALSLKSKGAAAVEWQKLCAMETAHELATMNGIAASSEVLACLLHASVTRPTDNVEMAYVLFMISLHYFSVIS